MPRRTNPSVVLELVFRKLCYFQSFVNMKQNKKNSKMLFNLMYILPSLALSGAGMI